MRIPVRRVVRRLVRRRLSASDDSPGTDADAARTASSSATSSRGAARILDRVRRRLSRQRRDVEPLRRLALDHPRARHDGHGVACGRRCAAPAKHDSPAPRSRSRSRGQPTTLSRSPSSNGMSWPDPNTPRAHGTDGPVPEPMRPARGVYWAGTPNARTDATDRDAVSTSDGDAERHDPSGESCRPAIASRARAAIQARRHMTADAVALRCSLNHDWASARHDRGTRMRPRRSAHVAALGRTRHKTPTT